MEAPSPVIRGPLDRTEHIAGMPIEIDTHHLDFDPAAMGAAFQWFRWMGATVSTYT